MISRRRRILRGFSRNTGKFPKGCNKSGFRTLPAARFFLFLKIPLPPTSSPSTTSTTNAPGAKSSSGNEPSTATNAPGKTSNSKNSPAKPKTSPGARNSEAGWATNSPSTGTTGSSTDAAKSALMSLIIMMVGTLIWRLCSLQFWMLGRILRI